MLRRLRTQLPEIWISYADMDSTTIFDFRGCHAPSLEELKKAIIKEVQGAVQFDGKAPSEWEIRIYYRDLQEIPEGISCNAVAIVYHRTTNRRPWYIST